ncbi:MAG: hypothetical protein AB1921_02035 [Thermodesulfobacteriota bacterium]
MALMSEVLNDWRFPAGVIFLGSLLGNLLFKVTPIPREARERTAPLVRAGILSMIAARAGRRDVENVADVVGAREMRAILALVKRQRRTHLVLGLLLGAAIVLVSFMYTPFTVVPDWVYAILGVAGLYGAWKLW